LNKPIVTAPKPPNLSNGARGRKVKNRVITSLSTTPDTWKPVNFQSLEIIEYSESSKMFVADLKEENDHLLRVRTELIEPIKRRYSHRSDLVCFYAALANELATVALECTKDLSPPLIGTELCQALAAYAIMNMSVYDNEAVWNEHLYLRHGSITYKRCCEILHALQVANVD
jgi:hypothetical protein